MTEEQNMPDEHRRVLAELALNPELANNRAILDFQSDPDEVF
jgi:hypothetical protein